MELKVRDSPASYRPALRLLQGPRVVQPQLQLPMHEGK